MLSDDAAVANGFSFQTAALRDTDSRTVMLPHSHTAGEPHSHAATQSYSHTVGEPDSHTVMQPYSHTATVCYALFFILPYSTVTYAELATYRLKAADACLLS